MLVGRRPSFWFCSDGISLLSALIRFPLAGAVEGEMRLGLFEAILMDRSCPVASRCSVILEGIALPTKPCVLRALLFLSFFVQGGSLSIE